MWKRRHLSLAQLKGMIKGANRCDFYSHLYNCALIRGKHTIGSQGQRTSEVDLGFYFLETWHCRKGSLCQQTLGTLLVSQCFSCSLFCDCSIQLSCCSSLTRSLHHGSPVGYSMYLCCAARILSGAIKPWDSPYFSKSLQKHTFVVAIDICCRFQ